MHRLIAASAVRSSYHISLPCLICSITLILGQSGQGRSNRGHAIGEQGMSVGDGVKRELAEVVEAEHDADAGPGRLLPTIATEDIDTARGYADASRASSTRRMYESDWRRFAAWCRERSLATLPADPRVVAVFLASEAAAGSAPATVGRRVAAIGWMHRRAGLQPPQKREGAAAILEVLAGIRRTHGQAPERKQAADADVLRATPGDHLRAVRDRAVLAFGMAGAFRRLELVALRMEDVLVVPEGLRVLVRRSKTDQEGAGATIAIPDGRRLQPKVLLARWVAQAGITDGLLFRRLTKGDSLTAEPMSDRAVARLVQSKALVAGYDPQRFAAHSLRSGFLTAAARSGASVFKMREVIRHKSMQVLADYVRDAELFRDHAGSGFL